MLIRSIADFHEITELYKKFLQRISKDKDGD
jgi:hypothetical protein